MVDWQPKKRKAFQEALQKVYPDYTDLQMFADYELGISLADIVPNENLSKVTYKLLNWFDSQQRLNEVYEAFKREHPNHIVIEELERRSFVAQTFNLTQADWEMLFDLFFPDDLADLQRAFKQGFEEALGFSFQRAQPNYPPLIELAQIRELLESYDADAKGPMLAVRFVESAIAEFHRSSEDGSRDLTGLEQWRDRISQQFAVPPPVSAPVQSTPCHAYLLVTLQEIGAEVNVYPELHITGLENPIRFGAQATTCLFDAVAAQISEWLRQAEAALAVEICDDKTVTLEVFLPDKHLEEDIATDWKVKDEWEDESELGEYRRLLVRSTGRIQKPQFQNDLAQAWQLLDQDVRAGKGCNRFHHQDVCPKKGKLPGLLRDHNATGLKLTAKLPAAPDERKHILKDITKAAIPIALWSSEITETDANILKAEFDSLLRQCHLTNFADLARQWRMLRRKSTSAKHIRLLCDRPDRLPNLPDPNREEDLLVAS